MSECECVTSFSGFYDRQLLVVEKSGTNGKEGYQEICLHNQFQGMVKRWSGQIRFYLFSKSGPGTTIRMEVASPSTSTINGDIRFQ